MSNQGITQQQMDEIITIINTNIRLRSDLTGFGKYIRIESFLLAQSTYLSDKKLLSR
ncbi:hypothetical protein H7169_01600 [Candidatus Gracilibacteria bacterium]|nr:hypothetical protein [Candidatus Gracilibacteria bacterium]